VSRGRHGSDGHVERGCGTEGGKALTVGTRGCSDERAFPENALAKGTISILQMRFRLPLDSEISSPILQMQASLHKQLETVLQVTIGKTFYYCGKSNFFEKKELIGKSDPYVRLCDRCLRSKQKQ
jgi:hypothetical protein